MNLIDKVKRKVNGAKVMLNRLAKRKRSYYARKMYVRYLDRCPIVDNMILLEAQDGGIPTGNVAAILKELYFEEEYKGYDIYLSGRAYTTEDRLQYVKSQGMDRVKVLSLDTAEYYKVLATAKYLITEVSFVHVFIKRPEQMLLNTWHGTPLKTLGKQMNNDYALIGNVQKNFFDADYLLCPNEFTRDVFVDDYMLRNFGRTKLLMAGYPRNQIFLNKNRREEVRKECGFGDKQIIAFMPTWRGSTGKVNGATQNIQLKKYFNEIDKLLGKDQVMYVKLHQMNVTAIDLSGYKNIHPFPKKYDSYEFLYASDVLITDYSSVFFDYAVSRQKIILFTYDKEDYLQDRGFYFPLEELPFPQVNTVEELVEEIKKPIGYDDTEFLKKFCSYDKPGITKALCHKFLFGESSTLIEEQDTPDNGKKNVMLFIGALEKNGVTTAALNLLNTLDRTKYNYAIMYRINDIRRHPEEVKRLPEGVAYYGFYHARSAKLFEMIPYMIWREVKILPFKWIRPVYERISARDARRVFSTMRIDKAIQFTGYAYEIIGIFESLTCDRTIFVHSDMEKEIETRGNSDRGLLSHAYKKYNTVAAVTEDMIPPAKRISEYNREKGAGKANIVHCKNVMDYKRVCSLAEEEITFDPQTILSVARERLLSVLDSDAKKIISLGRFSVEKSHDRLIHAFEKLRENKEYENVYLIILGGHGPLYESTLEMVKKSPSRDHIFLIQYMSNPYPLLKKCDALALTSLYEALGLVLAEADMVGVPCFSTDIPGPRTFMQKYGGLLVENNEEGILQGMQACLDGTAPKKLSIDYEEYNKEAIAQFESLIP